MIQTINIDLFWILNRPLGTAADWIAILFTFSGYTLCALLAAIAAMRFYGGLNKKNVQLLIFALIVGGISVTAIKSVYVKDRPLGYFGEFPEEAKARVHAPFRQHHHRTFPSGHSQTGFTVATVMALLFGRHKWWWFSWAALIALSRVRLGLHFPLDILAGSALGAVSAYLVFLFMRNGARSARSARSAQNSGEASPEKSSESG